jgi:hypothetical protein
MNPRVKKVIPKENYLLDLEFGNGEMRVFDVKPYLHYSVYEALKTSGIFYSAKVNDGTVQWQNDADFCPDTLYLESKPVLQR